MANRPVIEIPIDDAAFKRFYKLFGEYSAALDEMPEKWRNLGDAMGEAPKALEGSTITAKEALALAAAQAGVITEALEKATKAQSGLGRETSKSGKAMQGLSKAAHSVAGGIAAVGSWIIKIGAIGGLGALFSGFGIADLAGASLNRYKAAGQLGLSTGQAGSFQVNMQRFLGLGNVEAAANQQIDARNAPYLYGLGIDWNKATGEGPVELALQEYEAAAKAYREKTPGIPFGQTEGGMMASGLGLDINSIRNIAQNPAAFQGAERAYYHGIGGMQLKGEDLANLEIKFGNLGMTIQTALINRLDKLGPALGTLAQKISDLIIGFVDSKQFDDTVNAIGDDLIYLANRPWKQWGDDVGTLFNAIGAIVNGPVFKTIGAVFGIDPNPNAPKVKGTNEDLYQLLWGNDDLEDQAVPLAAESIWNAPGKLWNWGNTIGGSIVRAITGQESGGNYGAVNKDSGASGRYQFMPGTADSYLPDWWVKKYGKTIEGKANSAWLSNEGHIQDTVEQGYYKMLEAHAYKLSHIHNNAKLIAAGHYGGVGGMDLLARNDPRSRMWIKPNGDYDSSYHKGDYPSLAAYAKSVNDKAYKDAITHHATPSHPGAPPKANGHAPNRRTNNTPVKVSISNSTAARVDVSMNAASVS